MANSKVSALGAIGAAALSNLLHAVQGGTSYKMTLTQLKALFRHEDTFGNGDLAGNNLTINHNLGTIYPIVVVTDENDYLSDVSSLLEVTSVNQIVIHFGIM
ncbi:unnamed protein product [marine sediment metagenome]|uniref:Uncharacterized protein n=1 Tax=marine sediment metagenome TaxID=412755 RepID=X1UJG6_9ZZZZ